tara:strand:- start:1561 stop:1734 length:174 start_codon:yes stop_codon:yes gene_type:complete
VKPKVALKIALYTYCVTFSVDPVIAYQTPSKIIMEMLTIHGEAKRHEANEIDNALKR